MTEIRLPILQAQAGPPPNRTGDGVTSGSPCSSEGPSPLWPLALALSVVSAVVYFLVSSGVRNYFRWIAGLARSLSR